MIDVAYAAAGAAGPTTQGGILSMLPLVLIFIVFYFLLIRPQQKKAKEQQIFLGALEKGQQVVTSGGIHGKITGLTDKVVTLEVADGVRLKISRAYIMGPTVAAATEAGAACSIGGG